VTAIVQDGLIRPEQLETPEKLAALRSKVAKLRRLNQDYKAWTENYYATLQPRVDQLDVTPGMKNATNSGMLKTLAAAEAINKEFFEIEFTCCDQFEELASFMETQQGRYRVKDSKIIFQGPDGLAGYIAVVARLTETVAKEQGVQKRMVELRQRSTAPLKQMEAELQKRN
jgi:hypothetical protein